MPTFTTALDPAATNLLFSDARTANTFTDTPVSPDQMQAVYDLVKWAPTALNAQPLRVVLLQSDAAKARLVPLMAGANADRVAGAPLVALLAADLDFHEELPMLMPAYAGAKEMFDTNEEHRHTTAVQGAYLQAGYFILAVRAIGLDVGPMGGFDTDQVNAEFFPQGDHTVVLIVNIGHADPTGYRPRNPRLDYHQVVTAL